MAEIDDILQEFPKESRDIILALWGAMPASQRQEMLSLLPGLPGDPGKIRKLVRSGHENLQMSLGNKQEVAIIGPANVGKSTLFNQLIEGDVERAEVGPVPGTTRQNQEASAGPFTVVDTPGADAVGPVGERERALALAAAKEADFLVVMFDAVQGVKQTEQALFQELQRLHKPYIVVLNKMDLVRRDKMKVVAKAAENLGLEPAAIIPISAEEGKGLEEVVLAIVKAEPGLVAALGRALPEYRWSLAWRVISGAASTAALVALTPLPFIDFIPLVAIQISMILGIARIYNYEITMGRAREIATVFGAGFLARTLFYELSKLGGPPGWVIAAAVAGGTTVAMGYGASVWFERGERLTRERTQQIARTVTDYLTESLKGLGRRKPSRQGLRQRIQEALERSPMAEEPGRLETGAGETGRPPQEAVE